MTALAQDQELANSVRLAARRFATGVTVVAVQHGDTVHALTANSFLTLSLKPALVAVCMRPEGRMRPLMWRGRQFGVSVLSASQSEYARHFADLRRTGASPALSPLDGAGPPLVPACVAYFACEVERIHTVGDHDLIVGSVTSCGVGNERRPLTFLDGELRGTHDGTDRHDEPDSTDEVPGQGRQLSDCPAGAAQAPHGVMASDTPVRM
jgi:flavin reductase (DIM6/NTAB) family NADH-FMN oxidoreductase RutF